MPLAVATPESTLYQCNRTELRNYIINLPKSASHNYPKWVVDGIAASRSVPPSPTYNVSFKITAWEVSKYGVFSGPYFPAFGLNTDQKKLRLWTLFKQSILVKFITATAKARAATLKVFMDIYIEFNVKEDTRGQCES